MICMLHEYKFGHQGVETLGTNYIYIHILIYTYKYIDILLDTVCTNVVLENYLKD